MSTADVEERPRTLRRRAKKALRGVLMRLSLHTVPYLYLGYMWLVYRTSRVETFGPHPHELRRLCGGGVYALWHDEVFFVAYAFREYRGSTLASRGDAGAVITRMLELCRFEVFRGGSTTGRQRGSTAVVNDMIAHIRERPGVVYGITTDGSKGPVYRMKPGAVRIAVESDAAIGVVKTWCRRYFRLPTWDRTLVPLPFNHVVHVFSGPIVPDASARTPEGFDALCERVELQLCRVSAWARRLCEGLPLPRDWIDRFPERVRDEMARAEEPELFLGAGGAATLAGRRTPEMPNFAEIPWIAEHIRLYRTDPEKAHQWDSSALGGPGLLPTLLLTTKGRKTGEPRPSPLIYGTDGDAYVVIASKGGMPSHPLWYRNLEASPECELQVGAKKLRARARTAHGAERERLWKQMVAVYPPYTDYQKNTERTIPVVVLDPI